MIIKATQIQPDIFLLVSDQKIPEAADRDFMDWAELKRCYTPTASEMEEDDNGRWTVKVMKLPPDER